MSEDYIDRLRNEIKRLRQENAKLRSRDCRTCDGDGSIPGFLLGTRKVCPACGGSGQRGSGVVGRAL